MHGIEVGELLVLPFVSWEKEMKGKHRTNKIIVIAIIINLVES